MLHCLESAGMRHLTISAAVFLAVVYLAESATKKRIVLDVDGVTDDCQALTLALQTPEIEVGSSQYLRNFTVVKALHSISYRFV